MRDVAALGAIIQAKEGKNWWASFTQIISVMCTRNSLSVEMKRRVYRAVNIRKMAAPFFLALVLFISLNTIVSAKEEVKEITAYPGQTITDNELGFENIGMVTFDNVYAVASGEAADWVSPTTIHFGTVHPGEEIWKTYTIKVPEDAIIGQDYSLVWEYYSEEGYEGSIHNTIHVISEFLIPWWVWVVLILVLVVIPIIVIGVVIGRERKREKPITRICPQCGRTLPLDVKFCPYCGKTLGE